MGTCPSELATGRWDLAMVNKMSWDHETHLSPTFDFWAWRVGEIERQSPLNGWHRKGSRW